jgi:HD-GYP domain-containing protein (c-di-GMP phosphodiesterase class II)
MPQDRPPEFDYVEKVKVSAHDLTIGMYVCELDRDWLETPFMFQGFELKSPADIEEVKKHCKFVYIDLLRTRVEHVHLDAPPTHFNDRKPGNTSFRQEIQTAESETQKTSSLVKSLIDDIRFGSSIDIQIAKEAVSGCVASILRNPEAMLFMTQMREKSDLISQHAMNTCVYAVIVGRQMGYNAQQLEDIGTCGLLHDLGKVSVPDALLNKPDKLTPEEMAQVRLHARYGRDILMSARSVYAGAVDVAYAHHENLDGSGYPRGLRADELNLNTRIVAVVEKYDAIVTARPYRAAHNHLDALGILSTMVKRNLLDFEVVNHFVAYLGIYPPGSIVELTTGEKAIILETNRSQRLRPKILVVRDPDNNPVARFVDMSVKQLDEQNRPFKIKTVHRPESFGINIRDYRQVAMSLSP